MATSDASRNPDRAAAIAEIVDQFIASLDEGTSADAESLCRQFPHLMPDLAEALQNATLIRDARLAAATHPLSNLDDDFPTSATSSGSSQAARLFGDYELVQRIGGGGFGSVYLARNIASDDVVALKILKSRYSGNPQAITRFRNEARIAQKLDHSNIVRISAVGEHQGRHFLVMPYIDGEDLRRFTRAKPIPAKKAAEIMRDAARACDFAHNLNVIHRDIKPENILIDASTSQSLVTDFGLAKQIDASIGLTESLQAVGTPNYMAPEQADPKLGPVSRATDIYALGATLYFLLTGKEPFPRASGAGKEATLHEVLWDDPIPIEQLNPDVPADLNTICRKCMEKMPVDRYETAADLAADFDKFIADIPIATRLPGTIPRVRRLFQRRPAVAAAITALIVSIGVGAWLSTSLAFRAQRSEKQLVSANANVTVAQSQATEATRKQILQGYAADMQDAQQILAQGQMARLSELLAKYQKPGQFDPRGFEWQYLRNLCDAPSTLHFESQDAQWNRLSFDATGNELAAVDRTGAVVVWDLPKAKEAYRLAESVHSIAFSKDGKYCVLLLSTQGGQVEVHSAADGSLINSFTTGQNTSSMAIHPDGTKLLTGNADGELNLWEIPSGKRIAEVTAKFKGGALQGHSLDIQHGVIFDIAFSPDGQFFVVGLEDGTAQVWNLAQRTIVRRCPNLQNGPITGVVFSPDGKRVASQSFGRFEMQVNSFLNGGVMVWDSDTGSIISNFLPHPSKVGDGPLLSATDGVIPFGQFRPAFSSDGKRVFTSGDRSVQVWETESGKLLDELTGHDGLVVAVAISPDGKHVAGAGANHSVRVWPAGASRTCITIATNDFGIRGVAVSPDGNRLAAVCELGGELSVGQHGQNFTRSEDRSLRVSDTTNGQEVFHADKIKTLFEQPWFAAHGQQVVCGGSEYDLTTKQSSPLGPTNTQYEDAVGIETLVSTDNSFIARLVKFAHDATLVRTATAQTYATLSGHTDAITAMAISPDGRWIATGGADKTVRLWSSQDGKLIHTFSPHLAPITAVAFSADSSKLATGGMDRRVYVWNVADGSQIFLLQGHRREISGLTFSQDGHRLVSSSGLLSVDSADSGEVLLWDMQTGMQCLRLSAGDGNVYCGVAINPDNTRIYASVNAVGQASSGRLVAWNAAAPTH